MNLADNLVTSARDHGDNVAIRLDGAALSYVQLEDVSRRVAGLLAEYAVAGAHRRNRRGPCSLRRIWVGQSDQGGRGGGAYGSQSRCAGWGSTHESALLRVAQ